MPGYACSLLSRRDCACGGECSRARARRRLVYFTFACQLVLGGWLVACATPAQRARVEADRHGFVRKIVTGNDFPLVGYLSQSDAPDRLLHVYLEGDASPRRAARFRPPDPTPENPLVLRLMALDPAPSVHLGRPCHHGAPPCSPWYWTLGRYSDRVVDAMVAGVQSLRVELGAPGVVLIGHSGGGTLAMLMAARFPEVRAVVTLAGNLDVAAWTAHHGFEPLSDSLDPAARPPLPPEVVQLHLVGGRDRRVPPELTASAIERQAHADRHLFPEFDHGCCWGSIWPWVLEELERRLADAHRQPGP